MPDFILALDQGTTSTRAILFDHDAQPVATAQRELPQHFPAPGLVEHDATRIWEDAQGVMADVLKESGAKAGDVAAIGITNQRETSVVWDRRTGEPTGRAIVWQDRRTAGVCKSLPAEVIREKTGCPPDPYFSGTKFKLLLDAAGGVAEHAAGTIDSWLLFKLLGIHATDATNACRTLLWNLHTRDWDDELCDLLGVPREVLPDVRPTGGVFGETDLLGKPIPVASVIGDQQAALFGQLCTTPSSGKNTYGTGCFMLLHTGQSPQASQHGLLTTVALGAGDETTYALEGAILTAGAAVQWLRDGLGLIKAAADVEALAASVDDNGGVTFVPALAGLGAPHWDPDARGTIVGLTRGATAGHLARATLEGLAHQVADVFEAMQRDAPGHLKELRVDGGAAGNDLLLQIQADVLGVPVVRPAYLETTALGAAYLAGLAVGFWSDANDLRDRQRIDRTFEPTWDAGRRAEARAVWTVAVGRARSA